MQFYSIKKNIIIVNTRSYKEDPYRDVTFKVTCTADGNLKGEETFNLKTMLKVNEKVYLND